MDFNITLQPIISDWSYAGLYTSEQVQLYRLVVLSFADHVRERKLRQRKERFKINVLQYDSKEAVAQSVSALCLLNLLKTMVVSSSPDDGSFLFLVFIFILS